MPEAASPLEFSQHLDEQVKNYGAEKEVIDLSNAPTPTSHEHSFQDYGSRAQCTCGWGLFLDPEDKIFEGHLYRNDQLVI